MTRADLEAQLKALRELLAEARRRRLDPRAAYRRARLARAERNWRVYGQVRGNGGALRTRPPLPPEQSFGN